MNITHIRPNSSHIELTDYTYLFMSRNLDKFAVCCQIRGVFYTDNPVDFLLRKLYTA